MRIRDFTKEDRGLVMDMVERFYTSSNVPRSIPPENFAKIYDELCDGGSGRVRGLIIEVDGKIAGFCTLSFTYSIAAGGNVVLVDGVYVRKEYRGQGAGHAVVDFLRDEYRGSASRLRLEVAPHNQRALALYEKLGFKRLPYIQMISEEY